MSNIELSYQPNFIEGLSLNVNLAYNYTKGEYYARADSLLKSRVINASGIGINDEYESKETILSDYYVNYKKSIDALDTKIDLTGGYSYQNFTHSGKNKLVGDNVLYENGVIVGMDTLPTQIEPLEKRMISFFGRAIFDFKGKYLLTTSLRRDGSSKFSPAKQWGLFPSLAVAWRMSDEPWIQSLGIFSDLKLRAGYGVTGNEEIAPYLYNTFYKFGESDAAYQFGNEFVRTLRPKSVDPTIQWEETISTNIGFDAGLFEGRLNVSAEYYVKIVDKLLYNVAQPVGLNPGDKVTKNIGQVNNKGIELTIDGVIMDRKDLQWNLNFNVAKNTDKLSRIDTNSDPNFGGYSVSGISGNTGETIQVLKADERVYAFRTYQQRYDANGFPVYDVSDLTNMYVDQLTVDTDGDGVADAADGIINEFDQVVGPSPNPDWILGLTSNLSYKGFDLAMTWRANLGQTVYNNVASSQGYFDNLTNDVSQNNIHQSAYATGFKTIQLHSDYYLENGSFVKLDNITLGYTFDQLKFATMKAYCTVQNIATITKYSGVDPEVTNITDSIEGVDNNLYPRARTFILGLRANF